MYEICTIELPYSLYFLDTNFSIWKYEEIKRDQREIFVVLRELDLRSEFFSFNNGETDHRSAASCAARISIAQCARGRAGAEGDKDILKYNSRLEQALVESKTNNRLKGYEVYCANLNKKVWISHWDWETLINENS
jgi:hypothetical protein